MRRATIAEVLPLLLAPTKIVVFLSKSKCVAFSFRKFEISTNLIRMARAPFLQVVVGSGSVPSLRMVR